jgi:hypothetical protein
MLKELIDNMIAINRSKSQTPTFLSLIGQESREMTHSAFIAALLDPKGVHGQGTLFLRSFVDIFVPSMAESIDYESVKVEVERSLGEEDVDKFDDQISGRIDIYLEDKNNNVIVVENKIYAPDRPKQIARYWYYTRSAKCREVIYLTLDGHWPSSLSLDDEYQSRYILCSYSQHVIQWLNSCLVKINNQPALSALIEQYIQVLNNLTDEYRAAEYIASSYDTMKAALLAQSGVEIARQKVIAEFMEEIASYMSIDYHYRELLRNNSKLFQDKEGWHFDISDGLIDICIDQCLFIRVKSKDKNASHNDLQPSEEWKQSEDSEDLVWSYVMVDGEVLDFLNLSKPVQQFLGSSNSTRRFINSARKNVVKKTCDEIRRKINDLWYIKLSAE